VTGGTAPRLRAYYAASHDRLTEVPLVDVRTGDLSMEQDRVARLMPRLERGTAPQLEERFIRMTRASKSAPERERGGGIGRGLLGCLSQRAEGGLLREAHRRQQG